VQLVVALVYTTEALCEPRYSRHEDGARLIFHNSQGDAAIERKGQFHIKYIYIYIYVICLFFFVALEGQPCSIMFILGACVRLCRHRKAPIHNRAVQGRLPGFRIDMQCQKKKIDCPVEN